MMRSASVVKRVVEYVPSEGNGRTKKRRRDVQEDQQVARGDIQQEEETMAIFSSIG